MQSKCSLELELFFISICSIRTRSRKRDIFKKQNPNLTIKLRTPASPVVHIVIVTIVVARMITAPVPLHRLPALLHHHSKLVHHLVNACLADKVALRLNAAILMSSGT